MFREILAAIGVPGKISCRSQPRPCLLLVRIMPRHNEIVLEIVRRRQASSPPVTLNELHEMAKLLALPLLDGLDLPQLDAYQAWLTTEREEALQLRLSVLERITLHPETSDRDAVKWLRQWQRADPTSQQAAGILVPTLRRLGLWSSSTSKGAATCQWPA
ncbi:hypothetical protein [Mesorhizobium sp. M1406]|uniref:hypothetical protein n=1 Tax=Mesorhizobium sp. M1406 TaxID=2957099 RepID=UPI00333ACCF5